MQGIYFIQDLAVILVIAGVVGWMCQRIGLSVVVGFLVAGILVGPHTPTFSFVSSPDRIETLAQLGMVFLMFSIGMRLSLRKLSRLGLSLLFAAMRASADDSRVRAVVRFSIAARVAASGGVACIA